MSEQPKQDQDIKEVSMMDGLLKLREELKQLAKHEEIFSTEIRIFRVSLAEELLKHLIGKRFCKKRSVSPSSMLKVMKYDLNNSNTVIVHHILYIDKGYKVSTQIMSVDDLLLEYEEDNRGHYENALSWINEPK
jgi:hypothetical protein